LQDIPGAIEGTVFLGIDLGRDHINDKSKLGLTIFDARGRLLNEKSFPCLRNTDTLDLALLERVLRKFINANNKRPAHVIVHRDGRYMEGEVNDLCSVLMDFAAVTLVSIKKDSHTRLSTPKLEGAFLTLDERRILLVTNTQAQEGLSSMSHPLEIELNESGGISLEQAVAQVFWLSRVYQGSIYHPKRLPITTGRANNIAGTGGKNHMKGSH
jgi:argonaute-like protein implicated in RNA metabolism and viral defense